MDATNLLTGKFFHHRKCDLPDCDKKSPLWKVFCGCGRSFHIECTLPDRSVCRICESTLQTKLETLGHTANKAVSSNTGSTPRNHDQDEDTSDDDQSDDDDMCEDQPENNDANNRITMSLEQISLWKMPDAPHQ